MRLLLLESQWRVLVYFEIYFDVDDCNDSMDEIILCSMSRFGEFQWLETRIDFFAIATDGFRTPSEFSVSTERYARASAAPKYAEGTIIL